MDVRDFGFSGMTDDFEPFVMDEFDYHHPERISGNRDYIALEQNGNTHLILDTEDISVLDALAIEDFYGKIFNDVEPFGHTQT